VSIMDRGHIDTMEIKPQRKPRVNYSVEFKEQIVAECLQPHVSIASISRTHNLNANVVHRWVREFEQKTDLPALASRSQQASSPGFIQIADQLTENRTDNATLILSLSKADLSIDIEWPASRALECVHLLKALLL